jgi:hypothetical protein
MGPSTGSARTRPFGQGRVDVHAVFAVFRRQALALPDSLQSAVYLKFS